MPYLQHLNLGLVFNSRSGRLHAMQLHCFETKLPSLKLKTRPRQLSGPLPSDTVFPIWSNNKPCGDSAGTAYRWIGTSVTWCWPVRITCAKYPGWHQLWILADSGPTLTLNLRFGPHFGNWMCSSFRKVPEIWAQNVFDGKTRFSLHFVAIFVGHYNKKFSSKFPKIFVFAVLVTECFCSWNL
jgi:hypothetical protein